MRPALLRINQYRNRIPYFLTIFFLTFVVATQIAILYPPQVMGAEKSTNHRLDEPFTVTIWGLIDKNSVSVQIEPNTPVKTSWKSGFFPLVQQLVIEPAGLAQADSNYSIKVAVENWSGTTSVSKLAVKTESMPKVLSVSPAPDEENVLPDSEIAFTLDKTFTAGSYALLSEPNFDYDTQISDSKVLIMPKSRLTQGQKYNLNLLLKFAGGGTKSIYNGSFTVITPITLASSDPANGTTSVLKQAKITLTFNKAIDKQTFQKAFQLQPQVAGDFSWPDERSAVFSPSTTLKTNTSYSLKISAATLKGLDGSRLDNDLVITFKTAGPVRVIGFSPTGSTASPSSKIKVIFDQPVDHGSAQERFSLSPAVSGSFGWEGNTLVFQPIGLSLSASYKVTIAAGIKSIGGEDSTEVFSNTFTTTSERSRVIGYSVRGRPITATYFGLGPKKVLLIATMHGNEDNTGTMLSMWINYLRANQGSIGGDRTFIIVPWANPDGKAANRRFNAHDVDLNRNWGTSDWQSLTYLNNNSYPMGGGPYPFSEPETVALRNLITDEAPSVIITYHSAANLVIGDGISQGLGDWYAGQTGYGRAAAGPDDPNICGSALGYCITGAMEDWTSSRGFVTIVVELATGSSSEYNRNFPALKGLLTLPI